MFDSYKSNGIKEPFPIIKSSLNNHSLFSIKPLRPSDIPLVTSWSRKEGFAPGSGDLSIYRHTDKQGLWVAWLDRQPIGCIAGVRYNNAYGFIGLFLVVPEFRGNGYGLELWKHALQHLHDLPCIGLEAALNRVNDYSSWGFVSSSPTTRWQWVGEDELRGGKSNAANHQLDGLMTLEGEEIPSSAIQAYDSKREPSPRPHFLSDWLEHSSGNVLALMDSDGTCHGFGRIRPCLLQDGDGWRIGPLLADTPELADFLLRRLVKKHPGTVLLDSPGLNPFAKTLLENLGFQEVSQTLRMYRGDQPPTPMSEVYGLACLELG